jgi:hypothetical protein
MHMIAEQGVAWLKFSNAANYSPKEVGQSNCF